MLKLLHKWILKSPMWLHCPHICAICEYKDACSFDYEFEKWRDDKKAYKIRRKIRRQCMK